MNSNFEELQQKLEALVSPLLQEKNLELIELNCIRQGRGFLFQLFVDRPLGGITIEECAWVNRQLSQKLDEEPLTPEDHWLEVSSPGLDRPLKSEKDFKKVCGCEIRLFLNQPLEGKLEVQGLLKEVTVGRIMIRLLNNQDYVIPLNQVIKGLQVV